MSAVIGTAGWSIPAKDAAQFAPDGSALERYAGIFWGAEINSSFHRPHRASTWARWADSVPEGFRFSVKMPKTITHQAKLVDCAPFVAAFMEDVKPLGAKLAVLLVQLPPKLIFDAHVAGRFFDRLRDKTTAEIACEPRNASWFDEEADALLARQRVARVAADPALSPAAATPGGWPGLAYWRLHGSPSMYRSAYSEDALDLYARAIKDVLDEGRDAWCMFDNTAASEATSNALSLRSRLAAMQSEA